MLLQNASSAVYVVSAAEDGDASSLHEENAALRAALAARMDKLDAAQREAFLATHAALEERAADAGVVIPPVVAAAAAAAKVEKKAVPVSEKKTEIDVKAAPAPEETTIVVGDSKVVVEVASDSNLVFKFGSPSAQPSSAAVSNSNTATSLAPDGAGGAVPKTAAAAALTPSSSSTSTSTTSSSSSSSSAVNKETIETAAGGGAASSSSESESDSDVVAGGGAKKTTTRRRKSTSSTTGASSSSTTTKPRGTAKKTTTKKADPLSAARAAASAEAASHDAAAVLAGREQWLYVTVPATPVAGATCALYFNRSQSEALRDRPRLQVQARFNNWELEPAGDAPDRLEMIACGVSDFWRVLFTVPVEAYEFNFIFSDGEGLYDNNATQNYCMPVEGAMTKALWIDTAPERAETVFLARKEAEQVAAAQAAAEMETAALAADKQRAQEMVGEIKACYEEWSKADDALLPPTVWRTTANTATSVTLMYNAAASSSSLAGVTVGEGEVLTLKMGHNGWKGACDVAMKKKDGSWWEATVSVPPAAVALNFVVQYNGEFDNNGGADYKMPIANPKVKSGGGGGIAAWADGLLAGMSTDITAARHAAEKVAAERKKLRSDARIAVRTKAEDVRRKQMRHVLFTEPSTPAAGTTVTISYNPNSTVLHGAERVFLRGGYNRWRHPKSFGPIEMSAPSSGSEQHYTAAVTVPKDAYSLDFVFSDVEEGTGRYDNCGGLDYQMPVTGSVVAEPPLYVVHIAAEMAPIAKVGGLGDVVTALGRAVQEVGHQVEVILPRYDFFLQSPLLGATQFETDFEWEGTHIFVSSCMVEDLRCWFIEPANGMFATSTVYQGASDAAKFDFFSRAALEFLLRTQRQPDILHCHDWSTAEVAKSYWNEYHAYGLWRPKVVFTIHNLNYGAAAIGDAAYFSQRFTTVSPSYAWEIGGHPSIAPHSAKLMGIRNGIDIDIWDPETDQFLPVGYTADTVVEGKRAAREELQRRLGLSGWGDKPLVGVVTRLTKQKGTHLIAHSAWRTLDRGGQFVLLGSAPDPKVQAEFNGLAQQCGGENAAFCFAFDEPLSHLIYAACDLILVPSMFEPCGLTQMIAMRYGAVPVVRSTGGLKDTVFDVDIDKERAAWELEGSTNWQQDGVDATNGFAFDGTDADALDYALNRALDAWYNDRAWFSSLQERVMRQDWSWNKPAIDYVQLYYAALK